MQNTVEKLQGENKKLALKNDENAKKITELEKSLEKADSEADTSKKRDEKQKQFIIDLNLKIERINEEHKSKIEKLNEEHKSKVKGLNENLMELSAELEVANKEIKRLNGELESKISVTSEDIKRICMDAIDQLSVNGQSNNAILDATKKKFEENEDVKTAFSKLTHLSEGIMDELFARFSDDTFDHACFEKFAELESLLMLESAIEKALCTLGHKILSESANGSSGCCEFKVQQ